MPGEGHDLRAAAHRDGRLHQPRDGRDPRAVGVHGRLPLDDRAWDVRDQRHRARRGDAAGALPRGLPDGAQGPREAGLHRQPDARPWLLAGARDRQEGQGLRTHRPQAQAAGDGAAAGDGLRQRRGDPAAVRQLALHPQHDRLRHRRHPHRRGRPDRAVQEAASRGAAERRQRQGAAEPAVLRPQALRPHPGRPLQAQLPPRAGRRHRHPHPHPGRHPGARPRAGLAAQAPRPARGRGDRDQGLRGRGHEHAPGAGRRPPRRVRALRQPPPADRRRADPGGLPDRPLPHGAGGPRAPHDRGRRHHHAPDDHQHPPGRGGAEGVLRLLPAEPVHGPDQLAGRAHPPPPPVGPGCRRADPRAGPDRGPRRAPHPLRPHVPDRDPRGSEHRPHRLAVLVRRGVRVRLRHHPLPGGQGRGRDERGPPPRRDPGRGAADRPGEHPGGRQDRPPEGQRDPLPHPGRPVRHRRPQGRGPGGRVPRADLVGGHGHDPVPRARRRQPRADGLEHAAPGGAAADRRRPAGGHRDGAPRGARHRRRAARRQRRHGRLHRRRPDRRADHRRQEGGVRAAEVHALQPGHPDPPQAARRHRPEDQGRRRPRRRLLHRQGRDGPGQEPDGRLHVLGGLQLRGRHHPVPPPGQGRRAHLDPHRGVRDRRPHDQARRGGDHPRHPQPLRGVAAQPRRPRDRADRRRGPVRRPAGRQGHAEGRDRADGRGEADPGDLQGEGPRGPRHLPEGAPRRGRRRDRREDLPPRRRRRPAARGQRPRARVRRQEAQDLRGRQARGPSRQQGCDLEDRRGAGHAVPRGRDPRGRDPQPARRALPHERRADPRDPPRVGRRPGLVRRRLRGLQGRPRQRRERARVRVHPGVRRGHRRRTSTPPWSSGRTPTRAASAWTSTSPAARASGRPGR